MLVGCCAFILFNCILCDCSISSLLDVKFSPNINFAYFSHQLVAGVKTVRETDRQTDWRERGTLTYFPHCSPPPGPLPPHWATTSSFPGEKKKSSHSFSSNCTDMTFNFHIRFPIRWPCMQKMHDTCIEHGVQDQNSHEVVVRRSVDRVETSSGKLLNPKPPLMLHHEC